MSDVQYMRLALRLARRGYGATAPNPMVGAVLVKAGKVIGCGWHRRAGQPHAEIEALRDARLQGHNPRGATIYVTLEPCCTHGRTPPCTDAILAAGIKKVVAGTVDPNPQHAGKGFAVLCRAGIAVSVMDDSHFLPGRPNPIVPKTGRPGLKGKSVRNKVAADCAGLNESFNHWIVRRTPFVTVKAAMTLDGKIATATGESKWITGATARQFGMKLRRGSDAILVGVNTILADDPSLTVRGVEGNSQPRLRRIVLDSRARTPLKAKVVNDEFAALTTIVVGKHAPAKRVIALSKRVQILVAPATKTGRAPLQTSVPAAARRQAIDLKWLLKTLGAQNVTSLLVEGGGEVNASFLMGGHAQRVAFFYAPKILGGRDARKAVAGEGAGRLCEVLQLAGVRWRRLGEDVLLTAKVVPN